MSANPRHFTVNVPINRGQTALQTAKALKAALLKTSKGVLSAKFTKLKDGSIKVQVLHLEPKTKA